MIQDVDPNVLILSEQVQNLEAENKLLRKELRVVSMQSLSDLGQAQDAYAAQLAAEEKLAKATDFVERTLRHAGDNGDGFLADKAHDILAELKGVTT